MRAFLSFVFAIATLVGPAIAEAGPDRWTPVGPVGASATTVLADPLHAGVVYASDSQRLFKSTDNGVTWRPALALPTAAPVTSSTCVTSYFVHPADGTVFASACYGIFSSPDADSAWTTLNAGPANNILIVGGDPNNRLIVYGHIIQVGSRKSVDGGATWFSIDIGLPLGGVDKIVVDSSQSATLYGFGQSGGVFRSIDGGAHWTAANVGLPVSAIVNIIQIGNRLVLATADFGLYQSTDQALSWTAANGGLPDRPHIVALEGSAASLYTVAQTGSSFSTYRSNDGGNNWSAAGTFAAHTLSGIAANATQSVYAATDAGLVLSRDGASTWQSASVSSGLPNSPTYVLVPDANSASVLYASTNNGGFRSDDGGTHWNPLGPFNGFAPNPLAASPTQAGVVYGTSQVVVRSIDFGQTWTSIFFLTLHTGVNIVRESTSNPNTVAIGGAQDFPPMVFLRVSQDAGASWTDGTAGLPNSPLNALTIDPTNAQVMYAGVGASVYKTTNAGGLWVNMGAGLGPGTVTDIAVNPQQPNTLYAATTPANLSDATVGGLYQSLDGGLSWSHLPGLLHIALTTLTIDVHAPSTIYAGTNGQGVYRSADGGQTWTALSNGLTTSNALNVHAVAVDPADSRNVYIATDAGAFAMVLGQPGSAATIIEYYEPHFNDYFITLNPDEIQVLDIQRIPGWYRTGYTFQANPLPTPGTDPACRFYIPPASHFFSAYLPECEANAARNIPPFVLESTNAFYMASPDMTTGTCPAGTIPVYRLYNNHPEAANHRYTIDRSVQAQMVAKGYIAEGYGPNAVMLCAPN